MLRQGALAAAVAAQDADELAGRHVQVDPGQRQALAVVGELDVGAVNHMLPYCDPTGRLGAVGGRVDDAA